LGKFKPSPTRRFGWPVKAAATWLHRRFRFLHIEKPPLMVIQASPNSSFGQSRNPPNRATIN
jgi:hypothetical protein